MAPTLTDIDGFSHQTLNKAQAGSDFIGVYDTTQGTPTFETATKRRAEHVCSLKMVMSAAPVNVGRTIASQTEVYSVYFKVGTPPTGSSASLISLNGPTNPPKLRMNTSGQLVVAVGGSVLYTSTKSYADGVYHLADFSIDTSGTTYTAQLSVDGVILTSGATVAGQTAGQNITTWRLGSVNNDTITVEFQDFARSSTLADWPIGPHLILPLYPNGEGLDVLGTTNAIRDQAAGNTNLYQTVDDWNGGVPSTTDYTTYASTTLGDAASNYAEYTLTDPTQSVIWDVAGYLAGFADGTSPDTADLQAVLAAGTLIDHIGNLIDYSGSSTVLGFYHKFLARPSGGWDVTKLSGTKLRWGFSTDTNNIPRLAAAMLEYVSPESSQLIIWND